MFAAVQVEGYAPQVRLGHVSNTEATAGLGVHDTAVAVNVAGPVAGREKPVKDEFVFRLSFHIVRRVYSFVLQMSSLAQSVLDSQKLELGVASLVNRQDALALQYVLTPPVASVGERAFHQTVPPWFTLSIYPKNLCHIVRPVYQMLLNCQASPINDKGISAGSGPLFSGFHPTSKPVYRNFIESQALGKAASATTKVFFPTLT
jgi:hypothetical protein